MTLSPIKQALKALEDMQARLDASEHARNEPIALVGIGCRFPGGASDPDQLGRMVDVAGEVVAWGGLAREV